MSAERREKKVEYLELIYDLIFVYLIGRNNSLLQSVHNGFVYDHICYNLHGYVPMGSDHQS